MARKRDYGREYQQRIARGKAAGLTVQQARRSGVKPRKRPEVDEKIAAALGRMEEGISARKAAKELHIAPERLQTQLKTYGRKTKAKRWEIRYKEYGFTVRKTFFEKTDEEETKLTTAHFDVPTANHVGSYMGAVGNSLATGDDSYMAGYGGDIVSDVDGEAYALADDLWDIGDIEVDDTDIFSPYSTAGGGD